MRIAHIFHSIEDLEKRVSHGFRLKLEQLLYAYRLKKKAVTTPTMLRAMCVAFAFVEMAMDGEQTKAAQFYNMLHGKVSEHIEWEDSYLHYDDDTKNEELLMWDITCLLLDEHADTAPQFAFDIAERHVYMAYRLPQTAVTANSPKQTVRAGAHEQSVTAPAPQQLAAAIAEQTAPIIAPQQPSGVKEVPQCKPQDSTLRQAVAEELGHAQDSQTEAEYAQAMIKNTGLWESYAQYSKEELILKNVEKDVQLKVLSNMIDKLLSVLSPRDIKNFYHGDIGTQINGGDIEMSRHE